MEDASPLFERVVAGEPGAAEEFLPLVYAELRKLAAAWLAKENPGQTLDATALVHESYLRLCGGRRFENRGHFFATAAEAMRRILVDRARAKRRVKRGGGEARADVELDLFPAPLPDDDILALDEVLQLLAARHPERAALVKLRFFLGMTVEQAAAALDITEIAAHRRWRYTRAWLRMKLGDAGELLDAERAPPGKNAENPDSPDALSSL